MNTVGEEIIIINCAQMTEKEAFLDHPHVILADENHNPIV